MTKLNDTQLVILNAAALREDLGIAQIDRRAVTKDAIAVLLKSKHLKAAPRVSGLATWKDDAGEAHSLVVTAKALKALGIEVAAPASAVVETSPEHMKPRSRKADTAAAPGEASPAAGGSKLAVVIALMRRPEGATIADLMAATNWQAHSVRGAISGALKKKQGLAVISERIGETRSYRIA